MAQFWHSKILSLLSRRVFVLQKYFCVFPCAISAFKITFAACPDVFSAFGSVPTTSPAHFRSSGAFPMLSRRGFGFWERSHNFPGAVSAFGSIPTTSLAHFRLLGAFPLLPRCSFGVREHFSSANSAENIRKEVRHGNNGKGKRQGAFGGRVRIGGTESVVRRRRADACSGSMSLRASRTCRCVLRGMLATCIDAVSIGASRTRRYVLRRCVDAYSGTCSIRTSTVCRYVHRGRVDRREAGSWGATIAAQCAYWKRVGASFALQNSLSKQKACDGFLGRQP